MNYQQRVLEKENKESLLRQKVESAKNEIERLKLEKKEAWDEIKDFRVSAEKADANYKRMVNITRDITKMETFIKRTNKQLNG
jgi:predicted RNase H-like nuclease (RuvC/YqgF family)